MPRPNALNTTALSYAGQTESCGPRRLFAAELDRLGVKSICGVLAQTDCGFITARVYRAATSNPKSARAIRDEILC